VKRLSEGISSAQFFLFQGNSFIRRTPLRMMLSSAGFAKLAKGAGLKILSRKALRIRFAISVRPVVDFVAFSRTASTLKLAI
jgi:hypothetical protein